MNHNPFSTRKTSPGQIPFFAGDYVISRHEYEDRFYDDLYDSLQKTAYRSQVVGSHGTGKTTFLISFVRFLERQDHIVIHFTLHDGQRTITRKFWEWHNILVAQYKSGDIDNVPIAVIDGYEQLSLEQKIRLRMSCRKKRCGLLITTHTPAWNLPVLLRTEPTYQTLQSIVRHLFRDVTDVEPPDHLLCSSLFDRHQGNIRNVLFDLYDQYEEAASDKTEG